MNQSLCPKVVNALSLLSQKWNSLIIKTLLNGPSRFCKIESGIGISAKVLCERLKELEKEGIICRNIDTDNTIWYCLSEKGQAMKAIIEAIEQWAEKYN